MEQVRAYRDRFMRGYRTYSPQQQRLFALLAFLVVVLVIFEGLWMPSQRRLADGLRDYGEQRELWQWMQTQEPLVRQSAGEPATASREGNSTPLPTLLSDTAKENNLTIKRLEAGEEGKVTVTFEAAPFNQLIVWLDRLEQTRHVTVQSMNITKTDSAGMVNMTLQLKD